MTEISLIVLTWQRARPLKECLASIAAQDIDKNLFEVIVIDDGSLVNNKPVISEFEDILRIKYIKQHHKGVSAARNLGIKCAASRLVALIADDYRLPKNYISKVLDFFKNHTEALVLTFNILTKGNGIFNNLQQLYFQLSLLQNINPKCLNQDIIYSYNLNASRAAVFKREVFEKVGNFREDLETGEDHEYTLRLNKAEIPVYFLKNEYIQHFENKSLFSLLRQRFNYGKNFLRINKNDWTQISLIGVVKNVVKKYLYLFHLSYKLRKTKQYVFWSPFMFIFLATFFYGAYLGNKPKKLNARN